MRKPFHSLTSLRFVAAFFTVCYHFAPPSWRPDYGQVAVEFFFILSGFLMSCLYLPEGSAGPRSFLSRRLARVLPGYWLGWAAFLGCKIPYCLASHEPFPWKAGLLAIPALHAFWPSTAVMWNPASWSVSAEIFFYCVMAVILSFGAVKEWRRKQWMAVAAACFVVRMLFVAALVHAGMASSPLTADQMAEETFLGQSVVYSPLFRCPEFLFGVALGGLWLRRDARQDVLIGRWGATVSGLLIVATFMLLPKFLPREEMFSAVVLPVILMIPGGLMIYGLGCYEPLWARWIGSSPRFLLLGEASYVLYIIQFPLYYFMMELGLLGLRDQNGNGQFALYSVVGISISVAVHYFWERSAVAWLRDRLQPGHAVRAHARQLA